MILRQSHIERITLYYKHNLSKYFYVSVKFTDTCKHFEFALQNYLTLIDIRDDVYNKKDYQYINGKYTVSSNTGFRKLFLKYKIEYEGDILVLPPDTIFPIVEDIGYPIQYVLYLFDENNELYINLPPDKGKKRTFYHLYDLALISENLIGTLDILMENENVYLSDHISKLYSNINIKIVSVLQKFAILYKKLTGLTLSVRIISLKDINILGVSYPNLIILNETLLKYPITMLYTYMIHELIHQFLGIKIRFTGSGRWFLLESITEYLQCVFVKLIGGNSLFDIMLKKCEELYRSNFDASKKISISEYNENNNEREYLGLICGKGVLVIDMFIEKYGCNEKTLKNIALDLLNFKDGVTIVDFEGILIKYYGDGVKEFFKKWIYTADIDIGSEFFLLERRKSV